MLIEDIWLIEQPKWYVRRKPDDLAACECDLNLVFNIY